MKHLFIVKKGSLDVWKRLDPNDCVRTMSKKNSIPIETDSSIFLSLKVRLTKSTPVLILVSDGDDEATGDNRTLFSEIQLSGDVNDSTSSTNALDADFRLSRLRRSSVEDPRVSSALSAASRMVTNDVKVIELNQQFYLFVFILIEIPWFS